MQSRGTSHRLLTRRWYSRTLPRPVIGAPRRDGRVPPRGAPSSSGGHPGLQHDLGPAVVARVEVLVRLRRALERDLVADDEGRRRLAGGDQVAQLPVVPLHRRLAAADVLALEPEHAVVERDLAVLRELVLA